MGLLSTLFGRSKLRKPNRERFFSIVTAADTLRGRTDIRPAEAAGLVFNPVESSFFSNLDAEIRSLLRVSGHATGTRHEIKDDSYGTRWVVLDDRDFEDLVSTIHLVSETIYDHGFADRLLAAVFRFDYERKQAYWIYNYKRGAFYPLVLDGQRATGQCDRDAAWHDHGGGGDPGREVAGTLVRPLGHTFLAPYSPRGLAPPAALYARLVVRSTSRGLSESTRDRITPIAPKPAPIVKAIR